jgi:predicted NAD-dependent protein-ADP-ribosyltransferase YbiA (DUF1768 family)
VKVRVKNDQIVLVDVARDGPGISAALRALDGHALSVQIRSDVCIVLQDLGPREEACREPINITRSVDRRYVAISNLYPTPFILDDECYGSVEGFWQSLKCEAPALRRQVASLSGTEAKKAAGKGPPSETFDYMGETIRTGTHAHWALMERACTAKFTQVVFAREALLATGNRPLTHKVRGDSRTIPGVIMAAIWMRIRERIIAESPLPKLQYSA